MADRDEKSPRIGADALVLADGQLEQLVAA
jgi:hypothetical protein